MSAFEVDAVLAVADLVARTGATQFEIGYLRDETDDDYAERGPGWYASAFYRGARIIEDERRMPDEAADALARRLLDGGYCPACGARTALADPPAGKRRCRWRREGPAWVRGCDGKARATRNDEATP